MGILSLECMFRQLENWGQDPEDSKFGDLSDLVTQNLKWVLEESFEHEARHKAGCSLYERKDARSDYRNGYRTRDILTRFGRLEDVKVPRLRHSGFVPSILAPRRLALPDVEELTAKCLLCNHRRTNCPFGNVILGWYFGTLHEYKQLPKYDLYLYFGHPVMEFAEARTSFPRSFSSNP